MRIQLGRTRPLAALLLTGSLLLSGTAQAGTVRDDDGTMEASLDVDFTDDVAIKVLDLTGADLDGAAEARLWVYAEGQNCAAPGGSMTLTVNGSFVSSIAPCTVWSGTAFGWASLAVPLGALHPGANQFQIRDSGVSPLDRSAYFGIDQSHDYGRSVAIADGGADIEGELMWNLQLAPLVSTDPPRAHITIHRFSSGGTRLLVAPTTLGWTCTDVHTGLAVAPGATLVIPDPGITCTPPPASSGQCNSTDAGGYHANAGLGTLVVTSSCDGLSVSQSMSLPFSDPGVSTVVTGSGLTPWRCTIDESGLGGGQPPDYWVFCDVNIR